MSTQRDFLRLLVTAALLLTVGINQRSHFHSEIGVEAPTFLRGEFLSLPSLEELVHRLCEFLIGRHVLPMSCCRLRMALVFSMSDQGKMLKFRGGSVV